jgi:hypothetical protein
MDCALSVRLWALTYAYLLCVLDLGICCTVVPWETALLYASESKQLALPLSPSDFGLTVRHSWTSSLGVQAAETASETKCRSQLCFASIGSISSKPQHGEYTRGHDPGKCEVFNDSMRDRNVATQCMDQNVGKLRNWSLHSPSSNGCLGVILMESAMTLN